MREEREEGTGTSNQIRTEMFILQYTQYVYYITYMQLEINKWIKNGTLSYRYL